MKRILPAALLLCVTLLSLASFTNDSNPYLPAAPLGETDCVMVFTISDTECIKILSQKDSDFHAYGEWITGDGSRPVRLSEHIEPRGCGGSSVSGMNLEFFSPEERSHTVTGDEKVYWFEKNAREISYITELKSGEKIPVTYSAEPAENYRPRWVSERLLSFENTANSLYRADGLGFWYDFENERGEWLTNGATVPIRMTIWAVSPENVRLTVFDNADGQKILTAVGKLTDENTFVADEVSGEMFYKDTVTSLTIVKVPRSETRP